jgi:hypothetical protein
MYLEDTRRTFAPEYLANYPRGFSPLPIRLRDEGLEQGRFYYGRPEYHDPTAAAKSSRACFKSPPVKTRPVPVPDADAEILTFLPSATQMPSWLNVTTVITPSQTNGLLVPNKTLVVSAGLR